MIRKIKIEKIYSLMQAVFTGCGVPEDDAKICADVLITSDLRGIKSHGSGRLKMYYDRFKDGILFPETKIDVIRDMAAISVWDGNHGMGHVVGHKAMKTAIEKAKKYGIGAVAVRNSTHYGIAGYYALMAAKENMIGLSYTNARPSICPLFGITPMLGTNPIAFGAPSDLEYPFVYDAATSITQRGKIEVLDRANKPTPEGWVMDYKGETSTDTKQILKDLIAKKAALLALGGKEEETGGHKGYGLAMMVEIMSAALQSGKYLGDLSGFDEDGKPVTHNLGHYFQAINIEAFTDVEDFKKITGDIMRQMQNSALRPDKNRIWVAGEKEFDIEKEVRANGVEVNDALYRNMQIMIEELGLDFEI